MKLDLVVMIATACAASLLFIPASIEAVLCANNYVSRINVTTIAEAKDLASALKCTGGGVFDVSWFGSIAISRRIEISDGINLSVTGFSSSPSSSSSQTLDSSSDNSTGISRETSRDATIDAEGSTGIFSVSGGSTLHLKGLVLRGGNAEVGGAVAVGASSISSSAGASVDTVNAVDCKFFQNFAGRGGAIHVAHGAVVNIDGSTLFSENSADSFGGAVYVSTSELNIDGSTSFSNSTGAIGGAIYAYQSVVVMNGSTTIDSSSANSGGAIHSLSSNLSIAGRSTFINNSAVTNGGVLSSRHDSKLDIAGITHFTSNSAGVSGGALHCSDEVEFNIEGITSFVSNSANGSGGALFFSEVQLNMNGRTIFTSNSAVDNGGGIALMGSVLNCTGTASFTGGLAEAGGGVYAGSSQINISGETDFASNVAQEGGGIYAGYSDITIVGDTDFVFNAALEGGGIYADNSRITIVGDTDFVSSVAEDRERYRSYNSSFSVASSKTNFMNNSAGSDGGGAYLTDCKISIGKGVLFSKNDAVSGGGAINIINPKGLDINGVMYLSNFAEYGGAVSVASTQDSSREFEGCIFTDNEATDGGALYLYTSAGEETVADSVFTGNYAKLSGGALFHTGALTIENSLFLGNAAGQEGTAVFSIGTLQETPNVTFANNSLHCPIGQYGYDAGVEDGSSTTCRFELACSRCTSGCDDMPSSMFAFPEDTLPVCDVLPEGVDALSSGTTVASLSLQQGYYRTSDKSRVVRECFNENACRGGTDVDSYCATGYKGPYCAVCSEGYASGITYSCHACLGSKRNSSMAIAGVGFIIMVLVVCFVVSDLMRAVDGEGPNVLASVGAGRLNGEWKDVFSSCRNFIVNAIPLTAVKIVVVVWQIVTQFAAIIGDVYPEAYFKFISKLNPINFDIGFLLSYSCVIKINFYTRLVLATIGPLLVLGLLAFTNSIAKKRNKGSDSSLRRVQHKHLSAALFVAFFIYSSVSFVIFQTFMCDDLDDGVKYLRADYSLTCTTPTYHAFKAYAAFMVCVYPVGIPAFFTLMLLRNREDLQKPDRDDITHLEPLNDLWSAYKPSRYYYEVVECCRRIVLTGVAVFVLPDSVAQIAVVLLVAVVFLFVSESISPFEKRVDMGLYRWGNGVVLASMYVALLMKVDVSRGKGTLSVFSGVLIAAHIFMVFTIFVQSFLMIREWRLESKPAGEELKAVATFEMTPHVSPEFFDDLGGKGVRRNNYGGKSVGMGAIDFRGGKDDFLF